MVFISCLCQSALGALPPLFDSLNHFSTLHHRVQKLSAALRPMAVSQRGSAASSTVVHAPTSSASTATRIKAALTVSTAAPSSKASKAPTAAIDQENRRPIVNAPIGAVVKKPAAVVAVEAIVAKPKAVGLSAPLAPKPAKPSQLAAAKGGDTDLLDALYSDSAASASSAPSVPARPASGSDHLASSMARIDESFFAPRCDAIDALSHSMLAVEGVEEGEEAEAEAEEELELELETEHDAWLSAPTPQAAHSQSSFEQRRLSGGSWASASISQPNSPVASSSQPRQLHTQQPLAHAHALTAAAANHKKASPLRASDDCLVSSGAKTATGGSNKSAALFALASTAHAAAALSRSHGPSQPPRAFVAPASASVKLPPTALSIPAVPALDASSLSSSSSSSSEQQQQQQLQRSQLRSSALVEAIAITPRHTASRLMFFDEKWAEKQERAFTRWLNFLLDPSAAADSSSAAFSAATGDAKSSIAASTVASSSSSSSSTTAAAAAAAPSLAFGLSLADRLADAACRRDAQALYRAPANQQVIARLEQVCVYALACFWSLFAFWHSPLACWTVKPLHIDSHSSFGRPLLCLLMNMFSSSHSTASHPL